MQTDADHKKTWKPGDIGYLAEAEYSSNRPADIDATLRESKEEAEEDGRTWFTWLSEREQKYAEHWVRKYEVVSIEEDGSIGSMISVA